MTHGNKPTAIDLLPVSTVPHFAAVEEIQCASYGAEYWEDEQTFRSIADGYGKGAQILLVGGESAGYVFAYPCTEGAVRPINLHELILPQQPNCMYIHDLAVHPRFRNKGLGRYLLRYVDRITLTEAMDVQTLTAVQESCPFWLKFGFVRVRELVYGGLPATYMRRRGIHLRAPSGDPVIS